MNNNLYELVLDPEQIDFAPATTAQEILQNVLTICTTARNSVPMDREFGISPLYVDEPVSRAKAVFTQEVIRAVRKFEPRAKISRVEFSGNLDGEIFPRVFVRILDH